MKEDTKNKLEAEWRRQRLHSVLSHWKSVTILIIIAAIFAVISYDQPVILGELEATVVGVVQRQSETPRPSRVVIEFENGQRATIPRSRKYIPNIGARIIVRKSERELIGTVHFSFVRCVQLQSVCQKAKAE